MREAERQAGALAGLEAEQRGVLLRIAGAAFAVGLIEFAAGQAAGSQALAADALDFFATAVSCALALWRGDGWPEEVRTGVALIGSASLVLVGGWIGLETLYRCFARATPVPEVMACVGLLAAAGNGWVLYRLWPQRPEVSPLRRLWFGARNDLIGNSAVLIAAALVAMLRAAAPDLIVGGVMVVLFLAASGGPLLHNWRAWMLARGARPTAIPATTAPPPEAAGEPRA